MLASDHPDTPVLAASAFDPVVGDVDAFGQATNAPPARWFKVFIAAEGSGSADRIEQILADEGVTVDRITDIPDGGAVRRPGIHDVVVALPTVVPCSPEPSRSLLVEADLTR